MSFQINLNPQIFAQKLRGGDNDFDATNSNKSSSTVDEKLSNSSEDRPSSLMVQFKTEENFETDRNQRLSEDIGHNHNLYHHNDAEHSLMKMQIRKD